MPHPDKGYIYVLSEKFGSEVVSNVANVGDAVLSIKFSHNIAVLATKSGYASAISVIVDSHKIKEILGTVAGDNNIILILAETATHAGVTAKLQQIFPTLKYVE